MLAYLTFGSDIQAVVLVNLNPASKMVQAVRLNSPPHPDYSTDAFLGASSVFACHHALGTTATFPCDQDPREWLVHSLREGQHASQVVEELL